MAIWAHPLTLSDRSGSGVRSPGAHFPGGGEGTGSNSLPRTIRIAVWEIFSGGLRGLGNFFRGPSRYRKIILDQISLGVAQGRDRTAGTRRAKIFSR